MTLDARGTGMTLAGHALLARDVSDRYFVSVDFHRGCNSGNISTCLFGSTLALHSIGFSGRIVALAPR
jgi:hypothetical protein